VKFEDGLSISVLKKRAHFTKKKKEFKTDEFSKGDIFKKHRRFTVLASFTE
jgi:hypothetical protein